MLSFNLVRGAPRELLGVPPQITRSATEVCITTECSRSDSPEGKQPQMSRQLRRASRGPASNQCNPTQSSLPFRKNNAPGACLLLSGSVGLCAHQDDVGPLALAQEVMFNQQLHQRCPKLYSAVWHWRGDWSRSSVCLSPRPPESSL